jgi:hypothetical protein
VLDVSLILIPLLISVLTASRGVLARVAAIRICSKAWDIRTTLVAAASKGAKERMGEVTPEVVEFWIATMRDKSELNEPSHARERKHCLGFPR